MERSGFHVILTCVLLQCWFAQTVAMDGDWTLVKLTAAAQTTGAVCLDGSPAAYYIRAPMNKSASDVDSWVVFMEGGGWCGSDANCLSRAKTPLGSSTTYPTNIVSAEGTGLFDQFASSTVVYVKYCDGSSFTGDVDTPVSVGSNTIYYRGKRIFDAVFASLAAAGLNRADELLFSGCSAGALTTYVHADAVTALMAGFGNGAKVVALADAMFSLHHDDFAHTLNYYTRQFQWGYTAWNSTGSISPACLEAYPGNSSWMCFHGAIAASLTKTPLFIANSKYDTWQRAGVLSLNATECPGAVASNGTVQLCNASYGPEAIAEEKFWVSYGDAMMKAAVSLARQHSVFLTNCPTHCETGGPAWSNPAFPGTRLDAAVQQWYPQAIRNLGNVTWQAPRWIARDGDPCTTP